MGKTFSEDTEPELTPSQLNAELSTGPADYLTQLNGEFFQDIDKELEQILS